MLKFTAEHEWLKTEGDIATVGITEHASTQLGDLVFIELPKVGAVVESVKAASDVFAPLDGEVVEVNQSVINDPTIVSSAPLAAGWLYKLKLANPADLATLLDEAAYAKLIG